MLTTVRNTTNYCLFKADCWFKKVFKEQAGGAEIIATLIIIGIVLILAFAFRNQLVGLIENLWNSFVRDGNKDTSQQEVVNDWTWS